MKIAVLMSTYNGESYLNKQLESIANQTLIDNLTLYIRDDGSIDNTLDIIERWKSNINIVLYRGENIGPARSFWSLLINKEILADYYAFCDQDDIWDVDKIENGIEKLKDNIQLYMCNCRIIDEKDRVINNKRLLHAPNIDIQQLFVSGFTQGCSMVFSNELREYIWKMNLECIPMHDIMLTLYAKYHGGILFDEQPHFSYRVHSNNVVAKKNKSLSKKIKTIFWNWNNNKKNSMSKVAKEIIKNIPDIPADDRYFLNCISEYKKNRLLLIKIAMRSKLDSASVRSYIIRILIGMY